MKRMFKNYGVSVLAVGAMLVSASVSAYTVTVGGTAVSGEGLTTSVVGATVIDFNGHAVPGTLPTGYSGGMVVNGPLSGQYAPPPGDQSDYYTVGNYSSTPGVGVLSLGSLTEYFGFFGGSTDGKFDKYPHLVNYIDLYRGNDLLLTLDGDDLAGYTNFDADGDWANGAYWNIKADNASEYFDKVVFRSTGNAFETDNHAYVSAVPIPAAAWLFISGVVGLMGFSTRRKTA